MHSAAPDKHTVSVLRRIAPALGVAWPHGAQAGDVLATVDRGGPRHVAFVEHAAALLRGSSVVHLVRRCAAAAAAARRSQCSVRARHRAAAAFSRSLRHEICLAVKAHRQVPDWVQARMPELPDIMRRADRLAREVDRAAVDMTEAWLLASRVGETFQAVVLDADEYNGTVALDEPAVRARCSGEDLPIGQRITVRLVEADVPTRTVRFAATVPAQL